MQQLKDWKHEKSFSNAVLCAVERSCSFQFSMKKFYNLEALSIFQKRGVVFNSVATVVKLLKLKKVILKENKYYQSKEISHS